MDKVKIVYDKYELDRAEIQEVFRIFRNIADDAHYRHHPKKDWPLYDKLADWLGENNLEQHNEALRLRDEEENEDEWRDSLGRYQSSSEG